MKKIVKILSIDGGGIRGLIPAIVLKEIKDNIDNDKEIYEIFDLIAGTSTGGIIALGLTAPQIDDKTKAANTVKDLIDLYENNGSKIFPKWKFFNFLKTIIQVFEQKYSAKSLEKNLERLLKNTTIEDALTNILVPTYDIERRTPHFFKKWPLNTLKNVENFYMKDVARATSAAPTFFKPAKISPLSDGRKFSLVDGGVFANNPALCALIEAKKIYPNAEKYVIVSLGTGSVNRKYYYNKVKKWGFASWISPGNGVPLLSIMMDGQSDSANHQLKRLPGVEFYRFDTELINTNDELDDASQQNIIALKNLALLIIKYNKNKIVKLAKILS